MAHCDLMVGWLVGWLVGRLVIWLALYGKVTLISYCDSSNNRDIKDTSNNTFIIDGDSGDR